MSKICEIRANAIISEDRMRNNLELKDELEDEDKFEIWDRVWGLEWVLKVELKCWIGIVCSLLPNTRGHDRDTIGPLQSLKGRCRDTYRQAPYLEGQVLEGSYYPNNPE